MSWLKRILAPKRIFTRILVLCPTYCEFTKGLLQLILEIPGMREDAAPVIRDSAITWNDVGRKVDLTQIEGVVFVGHGDEEGLYLGKEKDNRGIGEFSISAVNSRMFGYACYSLAGASRTLVRRGWEVIGFYLQIPFVLVDKGSIQDDGTLRIDAVFAKPLKVAVEGLERGDDSETILDNLRDLYSREIGARKESRDKYTHAVRVALRMHRQLLGLER